MEDGRTFTDYRAHCATNFPTGQQFAARRWMQANADDIIGLSRKRQAQMTGAGQSYDPRIELPSAGYFKCDTVDCAVVITNMNGLGIERREVVPTLFGTFAESTPFFGKQDQPTLTRFEEGGRNTVRGKF